MTDMEGAESAVACVGVVCDFVEWEAIPAKLAHWPIEDFAVQVRALRMHKPTVVVSKMNMRKHGSLLLVRSFQDHRLESLVRTDSGRACD